MREELKLFEADDARELHDYLLGVLAELGGLPSAGVGCGVEQLRDRILGLLPAVIYYPILELDHGLPRLLCLWGDLLGERLQVVRGLLRVLIEGGVTA